MDEKDIVAHLRDPIGPSIAAGREAADEIERLRALLCEAVVDAERHANSLRRLSSLAGNPPA